MKKIYNISYWWMARYDGRRRLFRGITRAQFAAAVAKHYDRARDRWDHIPATRGAERREMLRYFAAIPYSYQGDGLDDYSKYQRPASNGRGWVAICPGEPGNNVYTEDPALVALLRRRYERHQANQ